MRKLYFKIHTVQHNSSPIDSITHVKECQFSLSPGRRCHKHSILMYDNTILVKISVNDPKKSATILVFTLFLCGWSRKLAPTSQPIKRKTNNLVTRIFLRFNQVACFEFSLVVVVTLLLRFRH